MHRLSRTLLVVGLHAASQLWIVSLLARHCPPEAVGHYVLAFALAAPIVMFLNARLRIVLANDTSADDPTRLLLRVRLATAVLGLMLIVPLGSVLANSTSGAAIVAWVALAKSAEAVSDIGYGTLQRRGLVAAVERSIAVRALLTFLVAGLVIPSTRDAVLGTAAVALLWSAHAMCDLALLHRRGIGQDTMGSTAATGWRNLLPAVRPYLPLSLAALLASVAYNVPRYGLAAAAPASTLGYYGVAAYGGQLLILIATAATEALVPPMTRAHRNNLHDGRYLAAIRRLYAALTAIGLLALALAAWVGAPVLAQVFGPAYAQHLDVVLLMLVAGLFVALGLCQIHVVIALGAFRAQMLAGAACFALLLLACAVLIPPFGLLGAACADVMYALLHFLAVEWIIHRHIRSRPNGPVQ